MCKTNHFFTIFEVEAMFLLAEQMVIIYFNKEEKGLYINNIERMDLVGIAEYAKKTNRKKVNSESMCSIYI